MFGYLRNEDVIYPYLVGQELNIHPLHEPSKWIINFHDWPLDETSAPSDYNGPTASDYPDCLAIVKAEVYPERTRRDAKGNYKLRNPLPHKWWIYADKRPELYRKLQNIKWGLAIATQATKYVAFGKVSGRKVYSHAVAIIACDSHGVAATISSSIHEAWARAYGGSNLLLLRYSPSDLFDTFPLPDANEALESIGSAYFELRTQIMTSRQEGLTTVYNLLHNAEESATDIQRLRELHQAMDEAVAAAYGWTDIALGHDFHETKQGVRFTIQETARREVLDRLLELNHRRYAEEVAQGLHEKKSSRKTVVSRQKKSKAGAGGVKRQPDLFAMEAQGDLFE